MELQRTANAGVLLKLDGVSILLDGLCDGVEGYLPTPPAIAEQLLENPPDLLAFTHGHADHLSEALLLPYRKQNLRPILGPESLYLGAVRVGDVTVKLVESRHLGKTEPGLQHQSFVIEGSQCVWFVGDAAPTQWMRQPELPKPDILIAPYAYALTSSAWKTACALADKVILLHLPLRENDPAGLWPMVDGVLADSVQPALLPELGQRLCL
jgi:L-ascorbate metabolism protein UlaG (beta-lactamase superfamily)